MFTVTNALVEISARHLHLTHHDATVLFPHGLTIKRTLSIPSEVVYNEKVEYGGMSFSILGPFRPYSQMELSYSDVRMLQLADIPKRLSGHIDGAPKAVVTTDWGSVEIPMIVPVKHLHVPFHSNLSIFSQVDVKTEEFTLRNVVVRGTPHCVKPTLHLCTDEGNALGVESCQIELLPVHVYNPMLPAAFAAKSIERMMASFVV